MFEPLNDLERLLMAAAQDPAQRPAFSTAVLEAQLFASPMNEPDAEGRVSGLRSVTLGEGAVAAAVFTAPERGTALFGPDILFLAHDGRTLLEWLRPGPVYLNPGQDYGVLWQPKELETLLTGMTTEIVQEETKVLLGHPAVRPDELIRRLSSTLGPSAAVDEAYLMLAHRIGEPDQTWMLGVGTSGDWRNVQALISAAVEGFAFDKPLDVVHLQGGSLDDALRQGVPIVSPRQRSPDSRPPPLIAATPQNQSAPSQKRRGLFNFFRED